MRLVCPVSGGQIAVELETVTGVPSGKRVPFQHNYAAANSPWNFHTHIVDNRPLPGKAFTSLRPKIHDATPLPEQP